MKKAYLALFFGMATTAVFASEEATEVKEKKEVETREQVETPEQESNEVTASETAE
jgi:hypothetical protein